MSDIIELKLATEEDAVCLHGLQVEAFLPLYEKYKDDDTSPAKESLEKVTWKILDENSDFYFIVYRGEKVGGVRVRWHQGEKVYENVNWLSPIFIIPEFQNKGIASQVMEQLFDMYPNTLEWRLDTIKQEKGNCHLYEKCGFVRVGEEIEVNEKMTLVDYVRTRNIPEDSKKPECSNKQKEKSVTLLDILQDEKKNQYSGGIYHKTQIDLTYNSNHMEGSCLTHEQTRYIFETNTIGVENEILNVDDVIETANHFRCIDRIIENAMGILSEKFIKELHLILKNGTSDSRKDWFAVGDYKKIPNEVGGMETVLPEEVADKMKALLTEYNAKTEKTLEDILSFHVKFEKIHPFQDGNGRIGRLIMFKECLKHNIVPFIIEDDLKMFYYRGLKEWDSEKGYLADTCLTAQDRYKGYLDYFRISY